MMPQRIDSDCSRRVRIKEKNAPKHKDRATRETQKKRNKKKREKERTEATKKCAEKGRWGWMETNAVDVEFTVCPDVEQSAGRVVGAGDEGVAVREKLDGIDVGFVTGKCLHGLAGTNIPKLGESVAGAGNEGVGVGGVEADAHDISKVVGEISNFLAGLDVPLNASHVTRGGEDAPIIDESTAREIASMARELPRHTGGTIALLVQVVDGANVVETTASDEIAARGIGTGHDPG